MVVLGGLRHDDLAAHGALAETVHPNHDGQNLVQPYGIQTHSLTDIRENRTPVAEKCTPHANMAGMATHPHMREHSGREASLGMGPNPCTLNPNP